MKYVLPSALLISISLVTVQLLLSTDMGREPGNENFDDYLALGKPILLVMYSNY